MIQTVRPSWLEHSVGKPPESALMFQAEAQITAFAPMSECGDFAFADAQGTLYRLDPLLNVSLLTGLYDPISQMAWTARGDLGIVVQNEKRLSAVDAQLKVVWSIDLPFACSAVAITPYGDHLLVASVDNDALILDRKGKKMCEIETLRPLTLAEFLYEEPVLFAAAEQGLLAAYRVNGKKIWEQAVRSAVGDLSVVQKEAQVSLAAHNHGIRVYNGKGNSVGSLLLEGTVNRISANYSGSQVFAATVENHLYRIDGGGELLWGAEPEFPVRGLMTHPVADSVVAVFEGNQALRLAWEK